MEVSGDEPVPPLCPLMVITIGAGFGHSRRDDSHARAETSFTPMRAERIHRAQIVNQLRQILNAVNIVMRRRRNQWRAGSGVTNPRDVFGNFRAGS